MYIEIFKEMMKTTPEPKGRYVFICDNKEILLNVVAIGYNALLLTEDKNEKNIFTLDSFKDYIASIDGQGTDLPSYVFVPACFKKRLNDSLERFFKERWIQFRTSGYTLFRKREYLGNYDKQEELEEILEDYIERFEGSRNHVRLEQFHVYNDAGTLTGICDIAIVEYIMDTEHIFVINNIAFVYEDGVYREDTGGIKLKSRIQGFLFRNEIRSNTLERIYKLLLTQPQIQKKFEEVNDYPAWWINFKNGMLDVKEWKMRKHKPEYLAMNQIPHEFNVKPDEGKCFIKFMNEAIPDNEDKKMILTYMGYCMTRDASFQQFLMIKGDGCTGKSRIISLAEHIVGKENFSNISLASLNERFYPTNLFGKLMNSCADISSTPLNTVDVIKKVTGEDEIAFERKGMDINGSFKSYAKLLFSSNKIPINLDEKSNAFYRRLLVLEMNVKPKEKDLCLDQKLKAETQYVILLACRYLREAYQNGELPNSPNSKRLINELYNDADSVKAWLDEKMQQDSNAVVSKSVLYKLYKDYCEEEDRAAHGRKGFYDSLKEKGYKEYRDANGRYIKGLTEKDSGFVAAGDNIPFQ